MADPRFFKNHGPFTLARICEKTGIALAGDGAFEVFDLAGLAAAGPQHLTFFSGAASQRDVRSASTVSWAPATVGYGFSARLTPLQFRTFLKSSFILT